MLDPNGHPTAGGGPHLEVADIFRAHGPAFRRDHHLTSGQLRAMLDIERCRTPALEGGYQEICNACAYSRSVYRSCGNRHCPKCQGLAQARWIDARMARVLPVMHFHAVFTLPALLRPLAKANPKVVFNILFQTAASTLLAFGQNPRHLGAQVGLTAVLHTWSRKLQFHPHLHCVVTSGGLDPTGTHWIQGRGKDKFLFPVRALSKVFRSRFVDAVDGARRDGALRFTGECADLADDAAFAAFRESLFQTPWVVYTKRPFGGAEKVFEYLGRYTHRVGISNHRLVSMDGDRVCFRTKGSATTRVSAQTFIERFLLHVLPKGFVKIRHYGLYASSNVKTRLAVAQSRLGAPPAQRRSERHDDWRDLYAALTGIDLKRCPRCGLGLLERYTAPTLVASGLPIEYRWEPQPQVGIAGLVRQDTGELLRERPLFPREGRPPDDPAPT